MKRKISTLFLVAIFAFMISGCGATSNSNSSDTSSNDNSSAKVKIVDSGYSIQSDDSDVYVCWGATIENMNSDYAYDFPTVTITAYDSDGAVLSTDDQVLSNIQPGEKQSFGSSLDCSGSKPEKVKFTISSGDKVQPSNDVIKSSDFKCSGTKERKDSYGDVSYTGQVENNSKIDTDSVAITVLIKKDGKIVYGDTSYVDNLKSGASKAFDIDVYDLPEHDSYAISALDWGTN